MTSLFYEIINNLTLLDKENSKEFVKKIENLIKSFTDHNDKENLMILGNKLEYLIHEYSKDKKSKKDMKKYIKKLEDLGEEIEENIEEIKQAEKKEQLVDVVEKVEKRYKKWDKVKEEKKHKYKNVGIKKKKIAYEKELIKLQLELVKLQRHIQETGDKVLIIFEGRDAAGKGGNIKRFTQYLNPRASRIVALPKPTDEEKTQWYFQRYVSQLPKGGEMVFFDRSWYNRAGVEPVMGFVNKIDYERFFDQVNDFEKMLIDSGTKIIKFYYSVSKSEQAERFEDRKRNPLKQFKLSSIDTQSQNLWEKYSIAEYNNFTRTNSDHAPWTIINSDNKKKSRINSIKYLLNQFDYPEKISDKELEYDKDIVYDADEKIKSLKSEVNIKKDLFGEDDED